ncbi:MAG: helix-turn-helix domain-containing protein [candidate division WOR-3 bacterium]|nr:helix-turn-helix domain-containing protein [candidate division WOR-3 bacterium]
MNTDKITQEITLYREIGKLLKDIRKRARLTQKDVGIRLGFSQKSGRVYVSRLERGLIENPSLWLILEFLNICEKPWPAFFEKLASIYFMKKHDKIMAQIPSTKYYKKIDRDVAKFTHSIETKFSEKQKIKPLTQDKKEQMTVQFAKHRVNIEPIEQEITKLLGETQVPIILNQFYKAFAREYYSLLRKTSVSSVSSVTNQRLNQIQDKWIKKGLQPEFLEKVKEIVVRYISAQHNPDI